MMEESARDVLEEWVRIITSNRGLMAVLIVLYLIGIIVAYDITRKKIMDDDDPMEVGLSAITSLMWPGMLIVGAVLFLVGYSFYLFGKFMDFLVYRFGKAIKTFGGKNRNEK